MKKSRSETVLNHNFFHAKPPLRSRQGLPESDWTKVARLSRSSEYETKTSIGPGNGSMFFRQRQHTGAASLPTSPTAESSPFR